MSLFWATVLVLQVPIELAVSLEGLAADFTHQRTRRQSIKRLFRHRRCFGQARADGGTGFCFHKITENKRVCPSLKRMWSHLGGNSQVEKNKRGVVYAGGSCFPQLGQKVAVASTGAPQFGQYLWPVDAVCGGGGGGGGGP